MPEIKSCVMQTKHGTRNACIYTFKEAIQASLPVVGDIFTCPSCGRRWEFIKNEGHRHFANKDGRVCKFLWHWPPSDHIEFGTPNVMESEVNS